MHCLCDGADRNREFTNAGQSWTLCRVVKIFSPAGQIRDFESRGKYHKRLAGDNKQWCAIGKNRIEQILKDSQTKSQKIRDFEDNYFEYSDEEIVQEEMEEEEEMEEDITDGSEETVGD